MSNQDGTENQDRGQESNVKQKPKTAKRSGPIRIEAIAPFTIFIALVWAYFFFFFDTHLKRSMEYIGTQINGAEVNIASVKTSFWKASLSIHRIQITDPEAPSKNKLQIGKITWKVLWDAILRGKLAIEEASVLEVALGVPRSKPGKVLPPSPPEAKSAFETIRDQALAKAQKEFSNNVLGDVASILNGIDPSEQLKTIEGQLKSSIRLRELKTELAKKEQEWKERVSSLPQKNDLDEIQKRLKSVKLDGFSSPRELQTSLSEIESIFKSIDAKYQTLQAARSALTSDVDTYQGTIKDLEAMVLQDLKELEERIKLPKLDVQSLSRSIFGPLFLSHVKQAEYYMGKAREYMPPEKTPEEKAQFSPPKPRERIDGRNYKFGRPNSYPLFWLKHAEISSKATRDAEWSGDLSGKIQDLTDDPPTLGRPTIATFKGDFPKQRLMGVLGEVTIDHRTSQPTERVKIIIDSFPIPSFLVLDSDEVKLGFSDCIGSTQFNAQLKSDSLEITTQNTFSRAQSNQPLVFAEAKQSILSEILSNAVAGIPKVDLNASVSGRWSDLSFNINSNLGDDLARALERQVQFKVAEAKAKLSAFVDEQIGKEKVKLQAEFTKFKLQAESLLKEKQADLDKTKIQIEQAKEEALKNEKKKLEQEAQKAIDQLKNKLKF